MKILLSSLILISGISIVEASTKRFIGGKKAQKGEFEASVQIAEYGSKCTAAKIGPRTYLTAAHCVVKNDPEDIRIEKDDYIRINTNGDYSLSTRVRELIIFPGYLEQMHTLWKNKEKHEAVDANFEDSIRVYAAYKQADFAIIKVKDFSSSIPVAELDFNPIPLNEKMVAGGYGCNRLGGYSTDEYFISEVTNAATLTDSEEYTKQLSADQIELGYNQLNTNNLGFTYKADKVSACHGDSGGPIYRASNKKLIGVNSFIFMEKDEEGTTIPYATFASRVTKHAKWLKETTQNYGEVDGIIQELEKGSCQAKVFYELLEKNTATKDLQGLCSVEELTKLEEAHRTLRLSRLEKMAGFNSQTFNKSWRELVQTAKIQDSILNQNADIPADFQVIPSFYNQVVSNHQISVFTKLNEANLLSAAQKKSYLEKNPQNLDQLLKALGEVETFSLIQELGVNRSAFIKSSDFWSFIKSNNYSLKKMCPGMRPDHLEYAGVSLEKMKLGYTALELYQSRISIRELVNEGKFTHQEIIDAGIPYNEFVNTYSVKELLAAGAALNTIKARGISIRSLIDESFRKEQIQEAGFSTPEALSVSNVPKLKQLGYLAGDFKGTGEYVFQSLQLSYSVEEILNAYSYSELVKLGMTANKLKTTYGLTAVKAKEENLPLLHLYSEYSLKELMVGGYTIENFRTLYCSYERTPCSQVSDKNGYLYGKPALMLSELKGLGLGLNALHAAGFNSKELHRAGYSLPEIKGLGHSIYEYYLETFTPKELVEMGFKKRDVKKALDAQGIEVKNSEF